MKIFIVLLVFLISGCVANIKAPFVDKGINSSYATVKGDDSNSNLKLWIGLIDGVAARKSVFGEAMLADADAGVDVMVGFHQVGAYCNYLAQGKYVWMDIGFEFENGKTYTISCKPNEASTAARYYVKDEQGRDIQFTISERPKKKD